MLTEEEKQQKKENEKKRKKRNIKRFWILAGIILFLLFFRSCVWGIIGVNIHYGEGERAVKIIKLSKKGYFWKTWEVEGVLTQGEGFAVTYIWRFSVDNQDPNKEKLLNDVRTAFKSGQTVKIKYDERGGSVPWRSDTRYFLKEVRFSD